mgnify:CR=1 FL=1
MNQLDKSTVSKIKSEQVITDVPSVVKELLEYDTRKKKSKLTKKKEIL